MGQSESTPMSDQSSHSEVVSCSSDMTEEADSTSTTSGQELSDSSSTPVYATSTSEGTSHDDLGMPLEFH